MKRNISTICLGCFGTLDSHRFCYRCKKRADDTLRSWSHLTPRTILNGEYLVGNFLGQGGFGITYTGWHIETGRKVAIKEFFPKAFTVRCDDRCTIAPYNSQYLAMFDRYKDMFMMEVGLLFRASKLPGIVKVLDLVEANNSVYMIMEFLDGVSLRTYLNSCGGKISFYHALAILLPVMESLKILHQMGLIHRDISPENIFIADRQYVKLIDFGGAIIYTNPDQKQLTQLKEGFAPLEQYTRNIMQGPWTDIYEIAATIYACCTSMIPYTAPTRAVSDYLLPINKMGVQCAPIQNNAIMKGLAIHVTDRYSNIGEFMENLYGPTIVMGKRDMMGNVYGNTNPFKVGRTNDRNY